MPALVKSAPRAGSSTLIPNDIIDDDRLTPFARLVYLAAARLSKEGAPDLTLDALAKRARCSEAVARQALRSLEEHGYLEEGSYAG